MYCNNCGHLNPAESNFCASCGAILSSSTEDTTVTFLPLDPAGEVSEEEVNVSLPELPSGAGMLVVKRGPSAGSRFTLEAEVTRAGRHPDSDIFLDDVTVSRRHAEFARLGAGYVIRDVGSLNGTYLNRERIEDAPLANGDEVQIGKFKLVYFARPSENSGSSET
ncbi:MAG: FHA domain-containing protein [Acidimicrobiales bacterium]